MVNPLKLPLEESNQMLGSIGTSHRKHYSHRQSAIIVAQLNDVQVTAANQRFDPAPTYRQIARASSCISRKYADINATDTSESSTSDEQPNDSKDWYDTVVEDDTTQRLSLAYEYLWTPEPETHQLLYYFIQLKEDEACYARLLRLLHERYAIPLLKHYGLAMTQEEKVIKPSKSLWRTLKSTLKKISDVGRSPSKRDRSTMPVHTVLQHTFDTLEYLLNLHTSLSEELNAIDIHQATLETLARIFDRYKQRMKIYIQYVSQQASIFIEFENMCVYNTEFRQVVASCDEGTSIQELRELSFQPWCRIQYYFETFAAMLAISHASKHTTQYSEQEYPTGASSLQQTLRWLNQIDQAMMPALSIVAQLAPVARLQRRISGLPAPLLAAALRLLRDDQLYWKEYRDQPPVPVHCFIFNDRLLITRITENGGLKYEAALALNTIQISSGTPPSSDSMPTHYAAYILSSGCMYTFQFSDPDTITQWRTLIAHAKAGTLARCYPTVHRS
jgi:hypothetical protein